VQWGCHKDPNVSNLTRVLNSVILYQDPSINCHTKQESQHVSMYRKYCQAFLVYYSVKINVWFWNSFPIHLKKWDYSNLAIRFIDLESAKSLIIS